MFKKIVECFKNFDKLTFKILRYGLYFCSIICIISIFTLLTYNLIFSIPFIYYIGICLFKLSLIFGIEFIICSFVVDGIKKQLI